MAIKFRGSAWGRSSFLAATLMAASLSTVSVIANPTPASARQIITCQSRRDRPEFCWVRTNGRVRLVRQLSRASCWRNWGYTSNRIWVRNGCRAQFAVGNRRYSNDSRYDRGDRYENDRDYRYNRKDDRDGYNRGDGYESDRDYRFNRRGR